MDPQGDRKQAMCTSARAMPPETDHLLVVRGNSGNIPPKSLHGSDWHPRAGCNIIAVYLTARMLGNLWPGLQRSGAGVKHRRTRGCLVWCCQTSRAMPLSSF